MSTESSILPPSLLNAQPDRHQALRLENNRAIKAAALQLAQERGLGQFSVEELAVRAEVSRRTFFNHFGSIHDATRAGLTDILMEASEGVIESLLRATEDRATETLAQLFEITSTTLLQIDFTPSISRMCSVLGMGQFKGEAAPWFAEVFAAIVGEIRDLMAVRAPGLPPVARNLLIENLLASVRVAAEIWIEDSAGLDDASGTALWHELHAQAIDLLRNGFAAA